MQINKDLIQQFENTIDTINPDRGKVPINILGYGEISLVFELIDDLSSIAYKRLPIFDTETQVNRHIAAYNKYHEILTKLGINLPKEDSIWIRSPQQKIVLYCAQEKVPPESIGNQIIHNRLNP